MRLPPVFPSRLAQQSPEQHSATFDRRKGQPLGFRPADRVLQLTELLWTTGALQTVEGEQVCEACCWGCVPDYISRCCVTFSKSVGGGGGSANLLDVLCDCLLPPVGPGLLYLALPAWFSLDNYFTEMCSVSQTGSYLRLIDCVYH